jgi:hypothetical protein
VKARNQRVPKPSATHGFAPAKRPLEVDAEIVCSILAPHNNGMDRSARLEFCVITSLRPSRPVIPTVTLPLSTSEIHRNPNHHRHSPEITLICIMTEVIPRVTLPELIAKSERIFTHHLPPDAPAGVFK